jgi:hypothetical protein
MIPRYGRRKLILAASKTYSLGLPHHSPMQAIKKLGMERIEAFQAAG